VAKTVVLPQGTYPVGTRVIGPFTVVTGATEYSFSFDKTNWQDPAVTVDVMFDLSLDGGATWNNPHPAVDPFPCGFTAEGGGLDKHGVSYADVTFSVLIPQPQNTQRRLRANVIIAGGPLTTSGSVTIN
jgi:hypothetical protein